MSNSAPAIDPANLTKWGLFKLSTRLILGAVWSRGRNFIFFPRQYDSNPEYEEWEKAVEKITYKSGRSSMVAFCDSSPERMPDRIWFLFGGNGTVALDWLPITTYAPQSNDAFVLFDYPGYGHSNGKPTQKTIANAVDSLIEVIAAKFEIPSDEISRRCFVMGHSLGAAVALDTALRHSMQNGVLISPFTSIPEIGELFFGKTLSKLAAERFDNLEALKTVTDGNPDSHFHIIHGKNDSQIPISMARKLNETAPDNTTLSEIAGAGHNNILNQLSKQLGECLTNGGAFIA